MNINIVVPDANAARVIDGICTATGWTAESGKTKAVWAKEKLIQWIKDTAKRGLLRDSMTSIASEVDPLSIA
jgi:hypothetical protein